MVEPHVRGEPPRVARPRQILRQQAVPQRQHRVHRVPRRTPVPPVHLERQRTRPRLLVRLHHPRELPEVHPRRIPLEPQQLLQRPRALRPLRHLLHPRQRLPVWLHVIPLQQRSLIADLPRHQPPRDGSREILLLRQPELVPPQEHVLRVQSQRDPVEPPAHREVADRHLRLAQRLHRLRGDLYVPHQVHLADLADPHLLQQLVLILHLQDRPALPDLHSLRVQVQRAQFAARRHHRADLALHRLSPRQIEERQLQRVVRPPLPPPPRLLGQTEPHQRTPRTLRRINQRGRNLSRFRQAPRPQDQRLRLRDHRLVEHHPHPLPRLAVVRDPFVAPVPTLPQDDSLAAELPPVRRPQFEPVGPVARTPVLVIHRGRHAVFHLDQVHLRDHPQALARERHAPRVDRLWDRRSRSVVCRLALRRGGAGASACQRPFYLPSRRQPCRPGIDALVLDGALHRVDALREQSLYPFVEEKPRTVCVLVDHPRRQIVRQ